MNERTGATDLNLVDFQSATFSGASLPTWNLADPSVVFNGGPSLNSYLNAGTGLTFDKLPNSQMTVVAKVYVNAPMTAAGVVEKNDGNSIDSGFVFGWDGSGALKLTVEKTAQNMRVGTAAGAIATGQWMRVAFTWDGTGDGRGSASVHHWGGAGQGVGRRWERLSRLFQCDEPAVPHRECQLRF
jgi:Concanavalin A-like lectin/glucanases superfamily